MRRAHMKYDAVSEQLNNVAMEGFAEDEYGSCQEEGFWAALIITDKMIYCDDLGRPVDEEDVKPLIGILEEDSQGFVEYELHSTEKAARDRWEDHVNRWEGLYHPEAAYA
jgi:hypothetical protein